MRATIVINDPALSASLPSSQLAAGSANAVGHALTALLSARSSPIAQAVGRAAIQHLNKAWAAPEPDRDALALGALLAGWSVDLSGLGPHHALVQSAARAAHLEHAHVNAMLLPQSIRAFRGRAARQLAAVDADLGRSLDDFAEALRASAAITDFGRLVRDAVILNHAVEAAAARPEMRFIPPTLEAAEIRNIYQAAAASLPATPGAKG
jgi:alcohol dehydrogenase class IV